MRKWILTEEELPPDETPVIVMLHGIPRILERRWEHPGWEETYGSFWYWDDPHNDGQEINPHHVICWMALPEVPTNFNKTNELGG